MFLRLSPIITMFIFAVSALAADKPYAKAKDLWLPQGAEVRIVAFDVKNHMMELESVKFPAEDASWVLTKEFGESIPLMKGQETRTQLQINAGKESYIGKTYVLTKKMRTFVHSSVFKKK